MKKVNGSPNEENHAKSCEICGKTLIGKQTKYCSRKCHNQCGNKKHQNYVAQQKRGLERKIRLLETLGRKCELCGYDRNYAGLSFHHKDPSKKSFSLDIRHCSNRSWDKLLAESEKCQLLCIRCHTEIHNPGLFV